MNRIIEELELADEQLEMVHGAYGDWNSGNWSSQSNDADVDNEVEIKNSWVKNSYIGNVSIWQSNWSKQEQEQKKPYYW